MEHLRFEDMQLSKEIYQAVLDMGFEEATPIQSQAIPLVKAGKDIIGQSQTGTGKTAAFGIPCLERIDPDDRRLQALILCPTRELAIQVADEIRKSGYFKYCLRKMASGGRYYVIKDGMVVRGAVLPVKMESLAKSGLRELADMVAKTTDAADVEDLSKQEDEENA